MLGRRAMPDPLPFPWGTFYIKNEKCWLQKEDAACFNDRSSFSYYGTRIMSKGRPGSCAAGLLGAAPSCHGLLCAQGPG